MGAEYEGQDKAIEELAGLSEAAKGYISHHIRNSLATIKLTAHVLERDFLTDCMYEINLSRVDEIDKAVNHIQQDLEKIGC